MCHHSHVALNPIEQTELAKLRALSTEVFGAEHLLGIAVVIHQAGKPVSQADLVRALGVSSASSLHRSLNRLRAGHFIEAVKVPGTNERPFRPCKCSFWAMITELQDLAGKIPRPTPPPPPPPLWE